MRGLIAGFAFAATIALAVSPGAAQGAQQKSALQKGPPQKGMSLPLNPPLAPPRPKGRLDERPSAEGVSRESRPQERTPQQARPVASEPAEASACIALLKEREALFTPVDRRSAEQSANGASSGDCVIDEPVSFKGVRLASGEAVSLDSAVTVRCALAAELALWMRDDLSAIAGRHGMVLRKLVGVGGHECRGRNRQNGTRISEHAIGNAFDVHKLEFEGGRVMDLMQDREETRRAMREDIRASACKRFPTVLGTGSDGYHEDHLHVDLRERRGGYRLCQWDVK